MKASKREQALPLGPVRRRLRRNRLLTGAAWGLAAGAGTALLLRAAYLVFPAFWAKPRLPDKWVGALLPAAAFAAAFGLVNALRPVSLLTAGAQADACGLKERVRTALEQADSDAPICRLQRADARRALENLDTRRIRPGSVRKQLLTALACGLLTLGLLLVPNGKDQAAAARKALRGTLQVGMEMVESAAAEDEQRLSPEKARELRRLTEELARELDRSRDEADALIALNRAEKRLEGFSNTADSGGQNPGDGNAENAAEAASEGAETDAQGQDGLASRQSISMAGASLRTLRAVSALKAAVTPVSTSRQLAAARTAAGAGYGQGQGLQKGASPGSVAAGTDASTGGGEGSGSGEAETGKRNDEGPVRGSRDPRYREKEYESIYDPERAERSIQDVQTEQNRQEGEENLQAEISPGKGSLGGSVPWGQVFEEYAETETRSAERENLTREERQWVADYYAGLTELR